MTSNPDVPPFTGYVETTVNALRLIHAARQGVIPRITRRLNDTERRNMIKSGAVFVFSVEESGIKRWTDGLLWSPSRIMGNFLVYREINERATSRPSHKKVHTPDDPTRSLSIRRDYPDRSPGSHHKHTGHPISDKPGGLIKRTITVNVEGSDLHLISYYTLEDVRSGKLKRPSSRPDIMSLYMSPHIFRLTAFRVPPKVEMGPDGKHRLVCVECDSNKIELNFRCRCESEDLDGATEVKMEERGYHHPSSWSSTHVNHPLPAQSYSGPQMYSPSHHSGSSPTLFSREANHEKWSMSVGEVRIAPLARQELAWSPSPSPTHHSHPITRRRESSNEVIAPQSFPVTNSSGRWQGHAYETTSENGIYHDRHSTNSDSYDPPAVLPQPQRDNDTLSPTFGARFPGHVSGSRELGSLSSQRLPWLARDATETSRNGRETHSGTSFANSPSIQFSPHGYQTHNYGSIWSASETTLIDGSPSLQTISSQPPLRAYDSYHSSNTISSASEFSSVDEYREH